jgi:hypothetical protein
VTAVSFIEANQVALANDIAKGQGKTLAAFLQLINKTDASPKKLQKNFETIFAKGNTPAAIHASIMKVIM